MADNLTTQSATPATIPASTVIATDDAGAGGHVQVVKLAVSTNGSATALTADNTDGLLVNLGANNDVTVTGTVAVTQSGTWDEIGINDSGNSITVDDGAGSLTVDNGGTFAVQESGAALTALQLIDDTVYTDGTGTPSKAIGIAGTDGTNPQIIKTDTAGELQVDVLSMPTTTVTGTITANLAAGTNNIGDVDILSIAAGDNNIGNVDVVSSALPSGASTLAEQQSQTTHLATIAGDTTDIETAVELLDDTVATLGTTTYTETSTKGLIMGAVRRDADTTLVDTTNEITPLQVDASGRLKVEVFDGGDSHTVDGSVSITGTVAVTQSGTWDEVGINDSGNLISVDDGAGSLTVDNGGTFAVQAAQSGTWNITNVSGTVSLPTGASTEATLSSVKTAVELIDDAIKTDDAGFTPATDKVMMVGAEFDNTSTDSVDEGDAGALRMSANRNLFVNIRDNAGNERGLNIDSSGNATVNVTGTVTVGSHAVTNAGTFATQVDGAALTALQLIDDTVFTDDGAFTPGTSKVSVIGFEADESSTDSVDEGDAGAARMTLDRKQIVTIQPHTAGGLSTFMASGSDGSTALTSTAQAVKASAGQLYGYYIYNPNSSAQFVHFYNTAAASVTVGTTNPLFTLTIPATSAANLNIAQGITFSNAGWSISATSTAGGNGAPSTALDAVVWYM